MKAFQLAEIAGIARALHLFYLESNLLKLFPNRCVPDNNGTSSCPTDWMPASSFSSATIAAYLQQSPKSIFTLTCNPYVNMSCLTSPVQVMLDVEDAVCAYKYVSLPDGTMSCGQYVMVTYPSTAVALEDNSILTHSGSCGLCSTTQDLAVYLSKSDIHTLPLFLHAHKFLIVILSFP